MANVASVDRPSTMDNTQFVGPRNRIASTIDPINLGSSAALSWMSRAKKYFGLSLSTECARSPS